MTLLLGCNSNSGNNVDSKTADGCVGHGSCPSDGGSNVLGFDTPEGGNLLVEYQQLTPTLQAAFQVGSGVTTQARAIVYFMDDQNPEANPGPSVGTCNNLEATHGWPYGVGNPHTDMNVGTVTLTGSNTAGSAVSIDLPVQPAGNDAIGRPHWIFYQDIHPSATDLLQYNSLYDVTLSGGNVTATGSGSADLGTANPGIPATTFGGDTYTQTTGGIYMSGNFNVMDPPFDDTSILSQGSDFPMSWDAVGGMSASTNLPAGEDLLGIVWVLDTNGSPVIMCPTEFSAGTITIGSAFIQDYVAAANARGTDPTHAVLLRQSVQHHIVQLPNGEPNNVRRLDLITLNCWAQFAAVQ